MSLNIIISEQQYKRLFLNEEELDIEYPQFLMDGAIDNLRDKCEIYLRELYNTDNDEMDEVDYESVDTCRALDSILSITVIKVVETSYVYKIDVVIEFSEDIPRPIGYGQDNVIAEIELVMGKYLNKQVHIFYDGM
jgi:hypothetical protein